MMPLLNFSSALMVGLLGSLHCLGMCGGIATALGMQGTEKNRGIPLRFIAYHLGRITTYCLLGAILGFSSQSLQQLLPALGPLLRVFAGVMLIAMGLYISQWWLGLIQLEKVGAKLWRLIQPLAGKALKQEKPLGMIFTGMLWGLLPCGLVYSTLALALASADPLQASITMLGFGFGTIPLLLISQMASFGVRNQIMQTLKNKTSRTIAGIILIACGVWTGFAALNHQGEHQGHHAGHDHEAIMRDAK